MSDLREKVARLIDPVSFSMTPGHYGLENEADFKRTMAYGAQLVASRKAAEIVAACMEEAAKVAEPRGVLECECCRDTSIAIAAALRALRGEGGAVDSGDNGREDRA